MTALDSEIQKFSALLNDRDGETKRCKNLGKSLARRILKQSDLSGFRALSLSKIVASVLYEITNHEESRGSGCGELFIRWTFERMYAEIVSLHLPIFDQAWTWLCENGARKDNILTWGDVDNSAWIEIVPKNEARRVIVVECHCAARDDNQYIFISDSSSFHMRSAWPKTVIYRGLKSSGGWQYVDKPSLALYRRQGFECQYGDSRDKGYSGSLLILEQKVDYAELYIGEIDSALYALRGIQNGINDPLYLPKAASVQ